jgi:hypothetical protein
MAAVSVGAKVTYHSENGDWVAWVVEYVEGREEGDYRVAGFDKAGQLFTRRSVVGKEQGAFSA